MKWLISTLQCPPGEFYYVQTEGIGRTFDRTPLINELANSVADFRKGNKLPRASAPEAFYDIVVFTCNRLNNDPQWVFETNTPDAGSLVPSFSGGSCSGCGASV